LAEFVDDPGGMRLRPVFSAIDPDLSREAPI
jgi:hypothetical protein